MLIVNFNCLIWILSISSVCIEFISISTPEDPLAYRPCLPTLLVSYIEQQENSCVAKYNYINFTLLSSSLSALVPWDLWSSKILLINYSTTCIQFMDYPRWILPFELMKSLVSYLNKRLYLKSKLFPAFMFALSLLNHILNPFRVETFSLRGEASYHSSKPFLTFWQISTSWNDYLSLFQDTQIFTNVYRRIIFSFKLISENEYISANLSTYEKEFSYLSKCLKFS